MNMTNSDMKFKEITIFIFSPFNTYIFLIIEEIRFGQNPNIQDDIIKELNKISVKFKGKQYTLKWEVENADYLKVSKGVFTPTSKPNSFLMGRLFNKDNNHNSIPIDKDINGSFKENDLKYDNIKVYIHASGVALLSLEVPIKIDRGITILELEQVSEKINNLFKEYFENICYQIAIKYSEIVKMLHVPSFRLEFLPKISAFSKGEISAHILPWTHRVYHIHNDRLFEYENPGEMFKYLLTPSSKMDVKDFSLYSNRYIYFGWGHSIIFTCNREDKFSQTKFTPYDYIRIIEIAQVNWRALEILLDLSDYAINWFYINVKKLDLKKIKKIIYNIRDFDVAMNRILDNFTGVNITFDTEKRVLLNELNERWLTEEMREKLNERLKMIDELLEDLFQRQKEKRDESLNKIFLIFTLISLIDIFATFFDVLTPDVILSTIAQILVLLSGTIGLGLLIIYYLKLAEKR